MEFGFNIESTSKEDGAKHVYHIHSEKVEIIKRLAGNTGLKAVDVLDMLKHKFAVQTSFVIYRRVEKNV